MGMGWNMKFELEKHHRDVADSELLDDLKRVAKELNAQKVTIDEYNERGKYHATTLTRRFGGWFVALERAGLKKTRNLNIADEALFENLVDVWANLGRQPKYSDINTDSSKYSAGTYEYRFGTWRKALEAFVAWANDGIVAVPEKTKKSRSAHKTKRNINWRLRALVLMRDGARCQLCGATPQDGVRLHVDHVLPYSKGGETVIENLRILCEKCNIGRSNIVK
jgi:Homing endonuclease associated repeat/HNH endonuclease